MLTLYTTKGVLMHVLPLPFGMALALLARREVERSRRPKPVWTSDGAELARERIRYMEALLGRLRDAGFAPESTYHAYHVLDAHIFGFSLWQAGHAVSVADLPKEFQSSEAFMDWLLQLFPPDEYPHFAQHVEQHFAEGPHQDVRAFEFALDLLLDGLRRELARQPSA